MGKRQACQGRSWEGGYLTRNLINVQKWLPGAGELQKFNTSSLFTMKYFHFLLFMNSSEDTPEWHPSSWNTLLMSSTNTGTPHFTSTMVVVPSAAPHLSQNVSSEIYNPSHWGLPWLPDMCLWFSWALNLCANDQDVIVLPSGLSQSTFFYISTAPVKVQACYHLSVGWLKWLFLSPSQS